MDVLGTVLAVFLAVLAVWLVFAAFNGLWLRYARARVTVFEHEAGVKHRLGRLVAVLGPGRYATWPAPVEITRVDLRAAILTLASQEILTADSLSVRVSAVIGYRVADARVHALASATPLPALYQVAQIALRARIAVRTLDELLADRASLTAGMAEELGEGAHALGYAITSVNVLDLSLAGPTKQAFADLWKAQKEGLAALERARGEQASLRSLANAARMLKGNPELMNLRLLQALSGGAGKAAPTLVLGGGAGLLPVASGPGDAAAEGEA